MNNTHQIHPSPSNVKEPRAQQNRFAFERHVCFTNDIMKCQMPSVEIFCSCSTKRASETGMTMMKDACALNLLVPLLFRPSVFPGGLNNGLDAADDDDACCMDDDVRGVPKKLAELCGGCFACAADATVACDCCCCCC